MIRLFATFLLPLPENKCHKSSGFRRKEVKMNKVYVIDSNKPLNDLKRMLNNCGGLTFAKIIYKNSNRGNRGNEKVQTDKTIVICPETTIQKFLQVYKEFDGKVHDYNWSSFPLPREDQGEIWKLHMSGVPNDYTVTDAEDFVIETLSCILKQKNEDGIENFHVEFGARCRESGQIHGHGSITFADHVDHEIAKLCKLILHNTMMNYKDYPENRRMATCVWHRRPEVATAQRFNPVTVDATSMTKSSRSEKESAVESV